MAPAAAVQTAAMASARFSPSGSMRRAAATTLAHSLEAAVAATPAKPRLPGHRERDAHRDPGQRPDHGRQLKHLRAVVGRALRRVEHGYRRGAGSLGVLEVLLL